MMFSEPLTIRRTCSMAGSDQFLWMAALLASFWTQFALAATIQAEIDRNPIRMGETLNLTLSANEAPDADPDLSSLETDFEVLGNSYDQQVSMVNGHTTHVTQWQVSIAPKRTGTLTIPAIRFGNDQSTALTVTVESAPRSATANTDADKQLFLEVEASPKNPYVQAQVIYTVRLLRKVNFSNADLSEPTAADALIQRLDDGRNYGVERNGERYAVVERKYAIFPQKSGSLHIGPVALNAQVLGGGASPFGGLFGRGARQVHLLSDSVDLEVRPVPAAFTGKHWLPAESVQVREQWSKEPPHTKAGEPITRTLTLHAVGATVGLLPEIGADAVTGAGNEIKPYLDQPVLNEEKSPSGITSTREEKAALIPGRAGRYATAKLAIPWWNTRTDRMEYARLPSQELIVDTASGTAAPVGAAAPRASSDASPAAPQRVVEADVDESSASSAWPWIALGLGLGWLATATAWFISHHRQRLNSAKADPGGQPRLNPRLTFKELQQACLRNDMLAARDALMLWAQAGWPDDPPVNLQSLASRVDADFARQVRELERLVYGPNLAAPWQGEDLWRAAQDQLRRTGQGKQIKKATLEPLYRLGN